jgi:hypothetical protein
VSRATLLVQFPDGTVRCGIYCGTSDVAYGFLVDTVREAWDRYVDHRDDVDHEVWQAAIYPEPEGEMEDVVVWNDYGGGAWWPAKAARNRVVAPRDIMEIPDADYHSGKPDWVIQYFGRSDEEAP